MSAAHISEALDLVALKEIATRAGGSSMRWKAEGYVIFGDWRASGAYASARGGPNGNAFATARHLAAFDPATALALIAMAERAAAQSESGQ